MTVHKTANYLLFFCSLFCLGLGAQSQVVQTVSGIGVKGKNFTATDDIFGTRVFVENKGQFDAKAREGEKILFAFDHGVEKVYFTSTGLIYDMIETFPLSEREREAEERGKVVTKRPDISHFVYMNWAGANGEAITVEAQEKQSHYITYGEAEFNSNTFKKLIYHNVYKDIDIEYLIPEEKSTGIKYNLILHQNADPTQVKILYSGEVDKIREKKSGDILIKTGLWDLVEHSPNSYYPTGEKVPSVFQLLEDTIAFAFPEGYEKNRELIVDPWVALLTTFTTQNLGYDVDFDFTGDLWVWGSLTMPKVARYSNTGIHLWTFSGVVSSQGWNTSGSVGAFAVDKTTGKSYVGQATNFPRVIRLDGLGNYDNFITPSNNLFQELWEMNFSCTSNDILIVGGGHTSNLSAATVNSATPVLVLSSFNPGNTAFVHDISAFCQDDLGNSFCYYACSNAALNHKITRVNGTYNGNVWTMPSGYNSLIEINNKNNYGGGSISSAGYNGLFANLSYLYYYDGANLAAYDKSTGTLVASTTVSFGVKQVGGIAVDNCDNIYIGGIGIIGCFNFNGVTFTPLTSIPLGVSTSLQKVYDVRLNKSTAQLYISGSGFCGTYAAIHSNGCLGGPGNCIFSQVTLAANTTSITCASLGSATIIPNNGIGPFSYTWYPSGQIGSSATGLAPGTHTIVVFDGGLNLTYTTVTSFSPAIPLTATISNTSYLKCFGVNNGTAAVTNVGGGSPNQTYTWTNGTNTYSTGSISNLGIGNYSVTIKDALTGCVVGHSFQITQPQQFSSFIIASTPTACISESITLTNIASGGIAPYTYTWTGGPLTDTRVVSENIAGTYIYTITNQDQNNCITSALGSVTFVPLPSLSVTNASICPFKTGTVSVSGATSFTWNGTNVGSSFADSPLVNSTYTVVGILAGCINSTTASISILPVPSPTISSNSPVCNGQNLSMTGSGGVSYVWQGPQAFSNAGVAPVIAGASPVHSGIYNLTVTAANSCTASTSSSLTVFPTPTVSATGASLCSIQNITLTASAGAATVFLWNGPVGFSSAQQNPVVMTPSANASGNYSLLIYSAQGCSNTTAAHVTVTNMPPLNPVNDGPKCEGLTVQLGAAPGQSGSIFSWSGPAGFTSPLLTSNLPNILPLAGGIYTLFVTEGPCQNSATTQVVVHPLPVVNASYNSPVCEKAQLSLSVTSLGSNTIVSYAWTGPGNYYSPQHYPLRNNASLNYSGTYLVTVTDIFGCSSQASANINILPNPSIIATGDIVCLHESARLYVTGASTYTWITGFAIAGNSSTLQINSASNVLPVTYTVFGTGVNTCTNVAVATLSTWPLPNVTAFVSPTVGCQNTEFVLTASGAQLYSWSGPLDFHAVGPEVRLRAFSKGCTGQYAVYGIDKNGCRNGGSTSIIVHPLPDAYLAGGPFSECVPFCGNYHLVTNNNSAPIIQATWRLNNQSVFNSPFKTCFSVPGDYAFQGQLQDANNCVSSIVANVHAAEKPDAEMSVSPAHPVENTDEIQFTDQSLGADITQWNWSLNDVNEGNIYSYKGQNISTFLPSHSGLYVMALVVKNYEGCADTALSSITVDQEFLVYVPNAFTPNSDSKNPEFYPVIRGHKFFNLRVFDRWGEQVFVGNEDGRGWDGTYLGKECKEDVYTWKLDVASKSGINKIYTGSVLLFR